MRKHFPNPLATSFGHLDQTRQGMRSTKAVVTEDIDDTTTYVPEAKQHIIMTVERTGRNFMDGTGKFPHTSLRGSQYMLIMYSTTRVTFT